MENRAGGAAVGYRAGISAAVGNLAFARALSWHPRSISPNLYHRLSTEGNIIRPTCRGTVDSRAFDRARLRHPSDRLSEATADKLRQMMIYAVENGTGTLALRQSEERGKTGTAQTGWVVDGEAVVQGWYAGFYPAEKPEYVIVVLAEDYEGSGGMPATPSGRYVMSFRCLKPCGDKRHKVILRQALRYGIGILPTVNISTAQKTEHYLSDGSHFPK